MRFQSLDDFNLPAETTADELDAARGVASWLVVLDLPEDAGPATKAAFPDLQWRDVGGSPALPFAELADLTIRYMRLDAGSDWRDKKFHLEQFTVAPLNRFWHLMAPKLGLHEVAPLATPAMEPRARRDKILEAIETFSDAEKDELVIRDDDWVTLSGALSPTQNDSQADYIKDLTWGMLSADGSLLGAVELIMACQGVHGPGAFLANAHGLAYWALKGAAAIVMAMHKDRVRDVGGGNHVELATEIGALVFQTGAAVPEEFITPRTPTERAAAYRRLAEVGPLSERNEAAAWRAFAALADDALAAYPTTLADDDAALAESGPRGDGPMLPLFSNARNARVHVRGEKRVLEHWKRVAQTRATDTHGIAEA